MSNRATEIAIDELIDLMTELGNLENQIRSLRESIEPLADDLYRDWERSQN